MESVASRDLRNHTADVLRRVAEGERIIVTVHGDAVAELVPPTGRRPRFLSRAELLSLVATSQADAGLRSTLAALAGETTEDLDPL